MISGQPLQLLQYWLLAAAPDCSAADTKPSLPLTPPAPTHISQPLWPGKFWDLCWDGWMGSCPVDTQKLALTENGGTTWFILIHHPLTLMVGGGLIVPSITFPNLLKIFHCDFWWSKKMQVLKQHLEAPHIRVRISFHKFSVNLNTILVLPIYSS